MQQNINYSKLNLKMQIITYSEIEMQMSNTNKKMQAQASM